MHVLHIVRALSCFVQCFKQPEELSVPAEILSRENTGFQMVAPLEVNLCFLHRVEDINAAQHVIGHAGKQHQLNA